MRTTLLVLVLGLVSSTALADVVGPPMNIECPPGARAATNHCGTVCVVAACATEGDCMTGEACVERAMCVEEIECGGWGATTQLAAGECARGCAEGTCQSPRVCVPQSIAADAGTGEPTHVTWSCGCRGAGSGGSSAPWILGALGLVALPILRRRAGRA